MLITAMIACLWAAAYLAWCEDRDEYIERVRERLRKM